MTSVAIGRYCLLSANDASTIRYPETVIRMKVRPALTMPSKRQDSLEAVARVKYETARTRLLNNTGRTVLAWELLSPAARAPWVAHVAGVLGGSQ